jgi:pimeloyl-ACP methyl ester carboxylesterase
MGDHPQPVSVTGGSDGVVANCDEIAAVAGRFGAVATDTLGAAMSLHGYLVSPAVLVSSFFDPVGFAEFEAELLGALDGWQGLSWAGAECGGIDAELRVAAAAYEAADQIGTGLHDAVVGGLDAIPALVDALAVLARTGDPVRAAESVVATDPELADLVVTLLGVPALLAAAGSAIPDGQGVVREPGLDRRGVAGRPPRGLGDTLEDLAQRNGDERHGEIDVRILTMADGSRRAIVDITGTKSWDPLPTDDVTSLTTSGRALVGDRTAYEDGVLDAMRAAGVQATDDVMLVGHSQGGMVAVTTARDAAASGEFNVTHVITAGAPVGLTVGTLPSTVQVLALENSQDVVPHLDGAANPDQPNVTTATAKHGDGTVLDDHSLDHAYVPLASDVEASTDKSIRDFLTSAAGYFQATNVQTHTYQIQRSY